MPRMVTVGVVALDDIKTPFDERKNILGGSATFASFAASFFTDVGLVAIVGEDFPEKHLELFRIKNICLKGLELKKGGKTFRWGCYYEGDMNSAVTTNTEFNSFEDFNPVLPEEYRNAEYLFLANMHPGLQLKAIEQMRNPKLIALDTMNYWIKNNLQELLEAIRRVDILLVNDGEARMLFKTQDLDAAARQALNLGSKAVIIKKGSEGASLYTENGRMDIPAVKLDKVVDPTGAGDSFAGGFMGYLAKAGDLSEETLRKAMKYATAMASFTVGGFSLETLETLDLKAVEERIQGLEG